MSASDTSRPVVTRFAPSPTGYLHIGGARTALFNWLYARHTGGKFLLRIEDTDRARSTSEAIDAILDGMRWLGLDWDGHEYYQSQFWSRHADIAHQLLDRGAAYRCYMTQEELAEQREKAKAERKPFRINSPWRDIVDEQDKPYVIRLKAPREGETAIDDQVQGRVTVQNAEIDDFILLRSDGTPTYMLAVVVDDHDMGVTHVIRGDDHLNNAFRQLAIIRAMGWPEPIYAHVPLIHGPDGAKLSKRHGAMGVDAYRDELGLLPEAVSNYLLRLGWGHGDDEIISRQQAIEWFDLPQVGKSPSRFDFKKLSKRHGAMGVDAYRDELGLLPEAVSNYLLRLGWGHGDDEIISREQAIEWFDLPQVGKSPSRFDFKKLENLNGHYIREADNGRLADLVAPRLGISTDQEKELLLRAMPELKGRAHTLNELAEGAQFLFARRPLDIDAAAAALLTPEARSILASAHAKLVALANWDAQVLEAAIREVAEGTGAKLGKLAQPLRAALTGRTTSPGIFDVLVLLGRDETLARIADQMEPNA